MFFLYGDIEESIYITLPEEDPKSRQCYVGKLVKAMYGTQSAPLVWQKLCKRVLESLGFDSCVTSHCVDFHSKRDIRVVTHVDDFAVTGSLEELKWFEKCISKEFEVKSEILGPGINELKEVKFLGRIIKWKKDGLTYEADPKHVGILSKE